MDDRPTERLNRGVPPRIEHEAGFRVGLLVEPGLSRFEEVDLGIREVTLERLRAERQEGKVVGSPATSVGVIVLPHSKTFPNW